MVRVRELAGWGLDRSSQRDCAAGAEEVRVRVGAADAMVAAREPVGEWEALSRAETEAMAPRLRREMAREDLAREMEGLEWEVGMVELGRLVAFQRRLVLENESSGGGLDVDVEGLMRRSFGGTQTAAYELWEEDGGFGLRSLDPDLRLRVGENGGLAVDGGSPFFEVAAWRGRWFLRDGYHRAYGWMRAGVWCVPAVMVQARSIEEVGARGAWCFGEAEMFSERPPMVRDFLDDGLCLEYEAPRRLKRMRVSVEEWMEEEGCDPAEAVPDAAGGQGNFP